MNIETALWVARYFVKCFDLVLTLKVEDSSLVVCLNCECEIWKRFTFEIVWF